MKLVEPKNTVTVTNSLESHSISIREEAMAQASRIFRDKIYSDKVLAPIREVISNGCDEHTKHNIKKLVEVHLPTDDEPFFSVRDFAKGLSKDDVFNVFFSYLNSTKRDDKNTIGCMGLGSKSPLAYTDTFVVTSYFEGEKSVYVGVNHGADCKAHLQSAEPSTEESGIKVSFEVKDVEVFRNKFSSFYSYFINYQELNVINPTDCPPVEIKDKIYQSSKNSVLYKGIVYKHDYLFTAGSVIFKIPDNITLAVHPSREMLEQVGVNENALRAFFRQYADQMVSDFIANFPESSVERWRALSNEQIPFYHTLGLDRKEYPHLSQHFYTSSLYNLWSVKDGFRKLKDTRAFYCETPIIFLKRKGLSQGIVETIVEKHGNGRIIAFCQKDDPMTFEEAREVVKRWGKYADCNFIDGSEYVAVKKPKGAKKELENFPVYDFVHKDWRRIMTSEVKKKVYWTEVFNREATSKVLNAQVIAFLSRKFLFVGVSKSNIKHIPDHWAKVEPLVKSIRRQVAKKGEAPQSAYKSPNYKIKEFVKPVSVRQIWPFEATKIRAEWRKKVKSHNKFISALDSLVETDMDLNIYLSAADAYNLETKFRIEAKNRIINIIKNL